MDFAVLKEDTHQVKQIEIDVISRRWIPIITAFFENQENQKRFEAWKSETNKKEPLRNLEAHNDSI